MQRKFYIIPAWEEMVTEKPYQSLAEIARRKNYEVIFIQPDWLRLLSLQIFPIGTEDIVFGFSLGAVLAYLVGQKYPSYKIILASMTPVWDYSKKLIEERWE